MKVWPEGETVDDKCPWGCIFFPNTNALHGPCLAPQAKDCHVGILLDDLSFTKRTIREDLVAPAKDESGE